MISQSYLKLCLNIVFPLIRNYRFSKKKKKIERNNVKLRSNNNFHSRTLHRYPLKRKITFLRVYETKRNIFPNIFSLDLEIVRVGVKNRI